MYSSMIYDHHDRQGHAIGRCEQSEKPSSHIAGILHQPIKARKTTTNTNTGTTRDVAPRLFCSYFSHRGRVSSVRGLPASGYERTTSTVEGHARHVNKPKHQSPAQISTRRAPRRTESRRYLLSRTSCSNRGMKWRQGLKWHTVLHAAAPVHAVIM